MNESGGAIFMEYAGMLLSGTPNGRAGKRAQRGTVARNWLATAAAMLSLAVLPAAGKDAGDWSRVQALRAGRRIEVDLADQRHVDCRFVRASDTDLTYQTSREITVSRESVVRVSGAPRLNRAARTLIGAAIGLGGSEIVNATVGRYFHNEGHDITVPTLGSGAAAGAVIGALTGGGYETIYRRPAAQPSTAGSR
jgi:hypothetical protein